MCIIDGIPVLPPRHLVFVKGKKCRYPGYVHYVHNFVYCSSQNILSRFWAKIEKLNSAKLRK